MSPHAATAVDSIDVVVRWPEPSPLDAWWTEIMDRVTPQTHDAPNQDPHLMPTYPSHRR